MRSLLVIVPLILCISADIVIPFPSLSVPKIRKEQSTAVRGRLLCNEKPYSKAKVKLYEVDPVVDTLLDESLSDANGTFLLKGTDTEWTTIDPKVNIYHNCEDEGIECWRKVSIVIPDDYITEGPVVEGIKTFDIGLLNLNAKLPGEERDCLN